MLEKFPWFSRVSFDLIPSIGIKIFYCCRWNSTSSFIWRKNEDFTRGNVVPGGFAILRNPLRNEQKNAFPLGEYFASSVFSNKDSEPRFSPLESASKTAPGNVFLVTGAECRCNGGRFYMDLPYSFLENLWKPSKGHVQISRAFPLNSPLFLTYWVTFWLNLYEKIETMSKMTCPFFAR
jgi:hypothetical protein